ncbi:HD domain-containing protein [Candidatus Beckwithbacteria bacterium]|nr:HD domain-containing protein [Candidatus Beckwithbacteria bacterium]
MEEKIEVIIRELENKIKSSQYLDSWFYSEHLLVVQKFALWLCKIYPTTNKDAVLLAVWLHDISRADGVDENHDQKGAQIARKILQENNFDNDFIDLIVKTCESHSCKKVKPESLEAKILATADAMSHFENGFYLRIYKNWNLKYEDALDKLYQKIERDYKQKLFFPEAIKKIKPMYEAWQKIKERIQTN